LEQRFLSLSSIKYVLSGTDMFSSTNSTKAAVKKVYDKEVVIYEFSHPLPRASVFYAAETLPDDRVLERLKESDFNPLERVILGEESLSPESSSVVNALGGGAAQPVSAANILSYESQRVRIETQTSAPAILVLNDANYPGWRALVNGQPAPILTADYLFRGVVVPSGHVRVEFVYAPTSFRVGAAISLASFVALVLPLIGLAISRPLGPSRAKPRISLRQALTSSSKGAAG
jgi:hypothetical protein